jgi:hypothetical protein
MSSRTFDFRFLDFENCDLILKNCDLIFEIFI